MKHPAKAKDWFSWRLVLMVLVIAAALWLRWSLGQMRTVVWDQNSRSDEVLMLVLTHLNEHFSSPETVLALQKTLSFPWLLWAGGQCRIDINTLMVLLWAMAAAAGSWLIFRASQSRGWALFAFLMILFHPAGLEAHTGVHFYRNLIIAPSLFVFFALLGLLLVAFWNKRTSVLSVLVPSLMLSFVWPFVFYIKEDGAWTWVVMLFFALLYVPGLCWNCGLKQSLVHRVILVLCIVLPFASFQAQTMRYVQANEKAFGYSGITLRTGGNLARLVNDIYKIDSDERDYRHWAPWDAIDAAVSVSPTLQQYPDVLEYIKEYPWFVESGIPADFLPWAIYIALENLDLYPGAARVDEVLGQAADEVEAAMETGQLEQSARLQITASAGGRTLEEIGKLLPDVLALYESAIVLRGWQYESPMPLDDEYQDLLEESIPLLGVDLRYPATQSQQQAMEKQMELSNAITHALFWIYRVLNVGLLALGLKRWFAGLGRLLRRRSLHRRHQAAMVYVFVVSGIGLVYSVGIVWFVQALKTELPMLPGDYWSLVFYGVGLVPMTLLPILMAAAMKPTERKKKNHPDGVKKEKRCA